MLYQRPASLHCAASAAFFVSWCVVTSGLAQPAAEAPGAYRSWWDMCKEHACNEFPMDHLTAYVGGQFYYLPMRRLTNPDWQTIDPKEQPLEILRPNFYQTPYLPRRMLSSGAFGIDDCCDELFRWFDLPEAGGNSASANNVSVHRSPQLFPGQEQSRSLRYLVYGKQAASLPEIDPPQIPVELRTDYSPSFWRLADSWDDMMLVSKEPILAESYVAMRCRSTTCDVDTLLPADGLKIPPLYVEIDLWSPDIEHDGAEKIADFVTTVDELLRIARVRPEER
jgi:hypothetical protein